MKSMTFITEKIKSNWKWVLPLFLVPAFFATFQLINYGKFADPDGFYHAKASQFLVAGKLTGNFPWNYYTTWREGYADQHYLYHLLITPFNTFPLMHWSIIIFSSLFVFVFIWLLSKLDIKWKFFWVLLLVLGSADFLFRINLIKANTLSLILILFAVWVIKQLGDDITSRARNKYLLILGLISAIFVWTYGGFVILPLIILAHMTATLMTERRVSFYPMLACLIGIVLAILLHPHSHNFISLIYDQLFQTGLGAGSEVPAGQEWLPFEIPWFIKSNAIMLALWVFSLAVHLLNFFHERKFNKTELWLHGVTTGMLILTLWHQRFIEYWTPFAVLAAAVVLSPYLTDIKNAFVKNLLKNDIRSSFWLLFVVALIASSFVFNTAKLQKSLSNSDRYTEFRGAAQAIARDSKGKSIVINTQWDQMPALFYWNDKDYYAVGLDPTFMYISNKDIYWRWRAIADGGLDNLKSREKINRSLKEGLLASYVFVQQDRNPNIFNHLSANPEYYDVLYKDDKTAAFKIK